MSKSISLVAISLTNELSSPVMLAAIQRNALQTTEAPVLKRRNIVPCHGSSGFHIQKTPWNLVS